MNTKNQIPWNQNDELFIKELKDGHSWQSLPALYFKLVGLKVEMPSLKVRDSINDAGKWLNSVDLIVNDIPLEIKSRNEAFTSPESFPYNTIFVDTTSGWLGKNPKPFAYVMISRKTGCMLWLPTSDYEDTWFVETKRDRVRNIRESFFTAPKENLKSMDLLIGSIKNETRT